jgi:hypothetical protein
VHEVDRNPGFLSKPSKKDDATTRRSLKKGNRNRLELQGEARNWACHQI